MPYPPLTLTKRLPLGHKLTPAQVDQNWSDIEAGVNAQLAALSVALNPNGTLKNNSVSTASIQDRAVTLAKLAFLSSFYAVDTGAANAMLISFTPPLTAYVEGLDFLVKAAATNTGATTINVDGVGLRNVMTFDGAVLSALKAGQVVQGNIYELVHDGAEFILLNPSDPGLLSGPVFLPAPVPLNPGGTSPMPWTDVDLNAIAAIPVTAKAVIIVCVNKNVDAGTDGQVLTEIKPDNAGSHAQIGCQMGGIHGTGTESSQQGIYQVGVVGPVPHIWFRVTMTTASGTAFIDLIGYVV